LKTFILFFFILVGCGESVNNFSKLSEQEKEYLRELGRQQCLKDNKQDFNSFKSQSAENFTDLERGDYYLHEVKSGSTVLRSIKIQVWKVSSGTLYFIFTTTTAEDSTPVYQFIKVTSSINTEMIDYVANLRCTSGSTGVTASSNSSNITYTKETSVPIEGDKKTVTSKTNTASYQYLALFGNYTYSQSVKTLTSDDKPTDTATVSTSGALTAKTPIDLAFGTYTGYSGATFCIPYVPGTPNTYAFPFVLSCSSGATAQFNPTELNL
jgi:hypothetical protein